MNIGILGTRGIPNTYGGFEQFAQHLSEGLVKKGHEVWVYNSHLHPYQEEQWNGVHIIHCKDWENRIGTAGQFVYDFNCFVDAGKRNFDVLLQLGYTSSSIWHKHWPKKTVNIVNMDGLEWKRSKYNKLTQIFLRHAEKLAAQQADILIADSPGIKEHLLTAYGKNAIYISYGAEALPKVQPETLNHFQLSPGQFYLVIARMEPENNIEMVIRGYLNSSKKIPLAIVGNTDNSFGQKMVAKYSGKDVHFPGPVYDPLQLNTLRHFSALYFHGHSVGGTNPSLLEAMGCECLIAAHDNLFNRAVLGKNAFYFSSAVDVAGILENGNDEDGSVKWKKINLEMIRTQFNWPEIINHYEAVFFKAVHSHAK